MEWKQSSSQIYNKCHREVFQETQRQISLGLPGVDTLPKAPPRQKVTIEAADDTTESTHARTFVDAVAARWQQQTAKILAARVHPIFPYRRKLLFEVPVGDNAPVVQWPSITLPQKQK